MATVKVFDSTGIKDLQCFDTLETIPYLVDEDETEPEEDNPFA